jgi:hypothetical protein
MDMLFYLLLELVLSSTHLNRPNPDFLLLFWLFTNIVFEKLKKYV